jgi:hypothetical protein
VTVTLIVDSAGQLVMSSRPMPVNSTNPTRRKTCSQPGERRNCGDRLEICPAAVAEAAAA